MTRSMGDLWRYRELLYMLTWREVRIRYKQSVMGILWAVLMPLIIVSAGILVRVAASKVSGKPVDGSDLAGVAVKALPWAFFVSALRFGTISLTANTNLVTKIKFPKIIFPLSAVLTSLFDMIVTLPLLLIILPIAHVHVGWQLLWVPLLLLLMVLLVTGLSIACAAGNLFFRDVKYLVEVILTYAIFFTPVLYDASLVGHWRTLLYLNPLAPLLESINGAVVYDRPPEMLWLAYAAVLSVGIFALSVVAFRRLEPRFAESI